MHGRERERAGGKGEEMTQTLYAHMNKRKKIIVNHKNNLKKKGICKDSVTPSKDQT
jgi:hypothetical protein